MNGTRNTDDTAARDNGDGLKPQQAAALLAETKLRARRRFEANPPVLSVIRALIVLAAYGGVWLSVRGQHPYQGPSGLAIAVLYILVIVVIAASVAVLRRATAGVKGKTQARPAEVIVLAAAWIAVYVFQGALEHSGVSHAVAYGVYPATAPLVIVGLVGAALAQGRSQWPTCAAALTVAVVATGGAFAGPAGAWLAAGIGLCAGLLVHAAVTTWQQRRA